MASQLGLWLIAGLAAFAALAPPGIALAQDTATAAAPLEAARAELAIQRAARPLDPLALAAALRGLGNLLADDPASVPEALALRREAVALLRRAQPGHEELLARALANLAATRDLVDDGSEEAAKAHAEALALMAEHVTGAVSVRAGMMMNYADHRDDSGDRQGGIATLREAIALLRTDPERPVALEALLLDSLDTLLANQNQPEDVLEVRRALVALHESGDPVDLATARVNLGMTLVMLDRGGEAEALFRLALPVMRDARGEADPGVRTIVTMLSAVASIGNRAAEANTGYDENLRLARQAVAAAAAGDEGPQRELVVALAMRGLSALTSGDVALAGSMLEEGLAVSQAHVAADNNANVGLLYGLMRLRGRQGRYAEAAGFGETALAIGSRVFGATAPFVTMIAAELGLIRAANDDLKGGLAAIAAARDALMSQPGQWNAYRSETRLLYARLQSILDRQDLAYLEARDVGAELLEGPGRSSGLDPSAREVLNRERKVFRLQLRYGWAAAQAARGL